MSVICALLFCSTPVYAQVAYKNPLTVIPGITDSATLQSISQVGLVGFINGIMRFIFIAAAIASVVMIVLIGFQYVVAEKSAPSVAALKGKITSLAWGIGLIASTWIILNTINPNIVNNINIFSTAPGAASPTQPQSSTNTPPEAQHQTFSTLTDSNAKLNAQTYAKSLRSNTCTPEMSAAITQESGTTHTIYDVYCKAPN